MLFDFLPLAQLPNDCDCVAGLQEPFASPMLFGLLEPFVYGFLVRERAWRICDGQKLVGTTSLHGLDSALQPFISSHIANLDELRAYSPNRVDQRSLAK